VYTVLLMVGFCQTLSNGILPTKLLLLYRVDFQRKGGPFQCFVIQGYCMQCQVFNGQYAVCQNSVC